MLDVRDIGVAHILVQAHATVVEIIVGGLGVLAEEARPLLNRIGRPTSWAAGHIGDRQALDGVPASELLSSD